MGRRTFTHPFFSLLAGVNLAGLCLALLSVAAQAELAVIVNANSPIQAVDARQLSDLYLGRTRALVAGHRAVILDQDRDSARRREFFQYINGMPIRQVNAYWARLQFSGEVQPPRQLPDDNAVIAAVQSNSEAIGYIDATAVTAGLRVLLRLP